MTMSARRLLNFVYGLAVDACADEAERDALDASLEAEPEARPLSKAETVAAMGGEVG